MPSTAQADRLARSVLTQRVALRPGETVFVEAFTSALPWATAFVREARRIGAKPLLHFEDEESYWASVRNHREEILGNPGDHEWAALERTNVYVYFWGPEDQARIGRLTEATYAKLTAFNRRWYETARKSGLRGVRMAIARATPANARYWGVPPEAWVRETLAASTRDPADLRPTALRLSRILERGSRVRIHHANGTDLTLALVGREPVVGLGQVTPATRKTRFGMMQSVPDANVYVAVDEGTADGRLVANRRNSQFGEPVPGGTFEFSGGRLRSYSFDRGAAVFREGYRPGTAGKDRPSFVEIGLDPAIRVSPGLEESEAGALTVGIGGNTSFGGANTSSFFGFLTVGGADLFVDDRAIVRKGRIV